MYAATTKNEGGVATNKEQFLAHPRDGERAGIRRRWAFFSSLMTQQLKDGGTHEETKQDQSLESDPKKEECQKLFEKI